MVNVEAILSLVLIILGVVTLYLSFWGFTKKKISGAIEFSLFLLCVSIYAFGYALEISYKDLPNILLMVKFEYLGIPYMSYFAVLFSYRFIMGRPLNKTVSVIMVIIPVITTFMAFTVEYNEYFYINPTVIQGEYFPVLSFTQGIFYKIRFIYQELISIGAIIFLVFRLFLDNAERRPQIIAMITAQIFPCIIAILFFLGFIPGGIDINPFSAFIVGAVFSIAILKFGMFEIVPQGRVIALDSIKEAFILFDRFGLVQDINKAAYDLNIIDLHIGSPMSSRSKFSKALKASILNDNYSFEYQYEDDKSQLYYYKVNIYKLSLAANREKEICVLIHDFTDVRVLMDRLELKATHDYLTKVKNRRSIMSESTKEISRTERSDNPATFIMIDIDFFKQLNDRYGHTAGDEMLIAVAARLQSGLRDIDQLGRYGGEEFLVVCPDTDKDSGIKTAERLRVLIQELSICFQGNELTATCSFGVHTFTTHDRSTIDKIIIKADKALYDAKNSGRNRVCYGE